MYLCAALLRGGFELFGQTRISQGTDRQHRAFAAPLQGAHHMGCECAVACAFQRQRGRIRHLRNGKNGGAWRIRVGVGVCTGGRRHQCIQRRLGLMHPGGAHHHMGDVNRRVAHQTRDQGPANGTEADQRDRDSGAGGHGVHSASVFFQNRPGKLGFEGTKGFHVHFEHHRAGCFERPRQGRRRVTFCAQRYVGDTH